MEYVLATKETKSLLCIVEEVSDLWAIERGDLFKGLYFVLGGTLNAIKGVTPEKLNTHKLFERLKQKKLKKLYWLHRLLLLVKLQHIILLNNIKQLNIKVSRLARGSCRR